MNGLEKTVFSFDAPEIPFGKGRSRAVGRKEQEVGDKNQTILAFDDLTAGIGLARSGGFDEESGVFLGVGVGRDMAVCHEGRPMRKRFVRREIFTDSVVFPPKEISFFIEAENGRRIVRWLFAISGRRGRNLFFQGGNEVFFARVGEGRQRADKAKEDAEKTVH